MTKIFLNSDKLVLILHLALDRSRFLACYARFDEILALGMSCSHFGLIQVWEGQLFSALRTREPLQGLFERR